jgi:predicted O-methyltransferase YrrM
MELLLQARGVAMVVPELFDAEHFRQFTAHEQGILAELEQEAIERDIPIVGPFVGKMLWMITRLMKVKRVLELGTATGYSAIWIANALRETGGRLTTIEWDLETANKAVANIETAGCSDLVEVQHGDAAELLFRYDANHFDLIFQDVEKEMYSELLDPCVRVLRKDGLLFCDNTAFKTAGAFLEESLKHPMLDGFHLYAFLPEHSPEYDGLTMLIKK